MVGDIDQSNPDAIGQFRADADSDTQYIIKFDETQLNRLIENELTILNGISVLLSFATPHNQSHP